ncbi:hypothetical protein Dacet_1210 [Denitrovibrio acetiphilus DSM 12809]|uniref:Lipoprotein n=1 Tax=Denitrovibrio acetiphilus (strain DSM 12809 / NBRC 114555 / N2460) TaxID=522772 RepID=D4H7I3_DENA2|nr:LPP20 family lipoprotein [Denitrovibrio acetiphilus]ADD67982.1 hypothetical protein Dacet_1210 [Denitrovibrio acetiphilus DSM 12809]
MGKIIIFSITVVLFLTGCGGAAKPTAKQDSAKIQQQRAEQAQKEMEQDITSGTLNMDFGGSSAISKPVEKPEAVMPPKKQPGKVGSLMPETKYPMRDGFPEWFYTPVYDGYIGAVGIAPKQRSNSLSAQKRVARVQAQKNLAKQIEVLINSDLNVESLSSGTATVESYRQKVTSMTREQADQFLNGFKVMDEWVDPKTDDYYIWMILEK